MPLNLPQAMQTLLTGDNASSRALQMVKNAVDPLLYFVNGTFQVLSDGSLRVVRNLVVSAFKADTTDAGALTGSSAQINGPLTVTSQATLGSLSTTTGLKGHVDMGWAWASGATAGTKYRTSQFMQNQEANNTFKFPTLFQPQFAGSILGIQTWTQGTAGGNVNVQLYKNQVSPTTAMLDVTAGNASTNVGNTLTYAKGVNAFVPLDYYITTVSFSVGGNQAAQVRLYFELTA